MWPDHLLIARPGLLAIVLTCPHTTSTRIGSISIILVGSCHYIYVKHIETSLPNKVPVEYSSRIIRQDRSGSAGYSSLRTDDVEALELRAMEEDIEELLKDTEPARVSQ